MRALQSASQSQPKGPSELQGTTREGTEHVAKQAFAATWTLSAPMF